MSVPGWRLFMDGLELEARDPRTVTDPQRRADLINVFTKALDLCFPIVAAPVTKDQPYEGLFIVPQRLNRQVV